MAQSIQALIDEGCARLGWDKTQSAKRARVLAALNEAEKFISQPGSFLYLERKYSLTVNSTASSVPLPTSPAIDFGKTMALRIVGEPGYLKWLPPDRFLTGGVATFYALRNDRPAYWTVMRDASGTLTVWVDPPNTSGGNLTLELVAQMAVADFVDDNAHFSLLPEGYELTLLLGRGVSQIGYQVARLDWKDKDEEVGGMIAIFQDSQRTNKAWPNTGGDAKGRKQDEEALDPESH